MGFNYATGWDGPFTLPTVNARPVAPFWALGADPDIYACTRLYDPDDPDGSKARLRRILMPRVTPWPDFEPFPRLTRIVSTVAACRSRVVAAWWVLRHGEDERW